MWGEHSYKVLCCTVHWGSSPHVRGALLQRQRHRIRAGIIPACAGSTWSMAIGTAWDGDHPRMCGEHVDPDNPESDPMGSSPHVRGALKCGFAAVPGLRIIPACAGSTGVVLMRFFFLTGSSPHVRGARGRTSFPSRFQGIIPACAGSTGRGSCAWCPPRDHPRMCGEHSRSFPVTWTPQGSSPHVRGAPLYENLII